MSGSIPYLSSPASGSPMGTVLHDHTARRPNPDADKGPRSCASVSAGLRSNSPKKTAAQKRIALHIPYVRRSFGSGIVDTISMTPKENGGTKMDRPAHPICPAFHRFGNHGHDLHDPHDSRCAASRWFRIMVMIASGPVTSVAQ
jgi:hypothetical protein